ncbi:MAG: tyrosine-type recombinase/integrase [Ignavibacteriaceae bacterium]
MAAIFKKNNMLWMRYYDKKRGYTVPLSLRLKDTRENRRKANDIKRQFEADLINGNSLRENSNNNSIKFSDAVEIFYSQRNMESNTKRIYEYAKEKFISAVGDIRIKEYSELDNLDFQNYLKKSKLTINTRSIITRHVSAYFNYFKKREWIKQNFITTIAEKEMPIVIINDSDINELLDYIKPRNLDAYLFVKILQLTGMRKSSALELRWENIDFNEKIIYVNNVKKDRTFPFPLTDEIENVLKEYGVKISGKIFNYSEDGLKFWYRYQYKLWNENRYAMHQLRKTFITKLIDEKYTLYDVATLADHRNIETTRKHYAKVNAGRLREQLNRGNLFSKSSRNEQNIGEIREK